MAYWIAEYHKTLYTPPGLSVVRARGSILDYRKSSSEDRAAILPGVLRLIGIQTSVLLVIALLWSSSGFRGVFFVLLGGYVFVIPNVFFAYFFFKMKRSNSSPRETVVKFYKYKLIKFALMIGIVTLVFSELPVMVFPFFSGLVGACLSVFLIPFFLGLNRDSRAFIV